jgi:hypothetical protein
MDNKVKGKNVVIAMLIDATYYPVFCCKTAEFTMLQDEFETTSINSGSSREYEPGMMNASLSISGVTTLDNTNGKVSITYLLQQAIRRTTQTFRMTLTDNDGDDLVISFSGFLTRGSLNRDVNGFSQSAVDIRITGDISIDEIILPPAPEEVYTIYKTCTAGQSSVQDNLLIGATVLIVARSGDVHEVTSGTPGNHQYRHTSATGVVDFDTTNPFNTGEVIMVNYKT